MHAILGLGNPGAAYSGTRHNVGHDAVDLLAERHGIRLVRQRHRALFGTGRIAGGAVLLARPLVYMNLSGEAARPLLEYHGLGAGDLVVIHDEADLEPGTVRVKFGGGIAGHNGLRSIVQHLGTRDFARVRIGIGRPERRGRDMADHVLSRPDRRQREGLERGVIDAVAAVERLLEDGLEAAMREFNRKDRPER